MDDEPTYTLAQIKAAFWREFHEGGELWFPPEKTGKDDAERCTSNAWAQFCASLKEVGSNG